MELDFNVRNLIFFLVLFLYISIGSYAFSSNSEIEYYKESDNVLSDSEGYEDDVTEGSGNNLEGEEERVRKELNHYKKRIKSKGYANPSVLDSIWDTGNYLLYDLMIESLLLPFYNFSSEWQDAINHHVIDPVRKGKHYFRYMDTVMLGTFDNMVRVNTGSFTTPFHFLWGVVFKNVISDFKLGSEVRSPGIIDSKYHYHPLLVKRLGAETGTVAKKMAGTHGHELVVIDVVKPFMFAFDLGEGDEDEEQSENDDDMVEEYEITDEKKISDEYEMVDDYEDKKRRNRQEMQADTIALLYKFFYATRKLVTGIKPIMEFEKTDYFKRTGRYEESDRTFLFHWNKTISNRNSFRSGQIVRVDRKGYFSMGPIPLAWNYCEIMLHEGGAKNKKVLVQRHEKEIYYEHKETNIWGMRREKIKMKPVERIRTVRRKVVKQVPNINKYRVYTENLCQAAEASVRSKTEVVAFATQRTFSWLMPGMIFLGAPAFSYLLTSPQNHGTYYRLTTGLIAVALLISGYYPSLWVPEVTDTIHSIKFPPPDDY